MNCECTNYTNNLVSAACINQKIYLFQKNVSNNYVTMFYHSNGVLVNQPLFETSIDFARIAVRDVDGDGYFEMAVIGSDVVNFFRLEDETNIASWSDLNANQMTATCCANFETVIFLKLPEPITLSDPRIPPIVIALLLVSIVAVAVFYQPICRCFRRLQKC